MAVYVDKARNSFRGMRMCHMISSDLEALHEMALKIGMKREWFQDKRTPHYDVCLKRRKLAIEAGAIEIGRRETGALSKIIREAYHAEKQQELL